MKDFASYNPIVQFIYVFGVVFVVMFSQNPVFIAISLFCAVLAVVFATGGTRLTFHALLLGMFIATAVINPLFYHNGKTVLFFINNNPITLEAAFYGLAAAGMICSVIYWFKLFTFCFTGDRLLYLFGLISPKAALVISMALRFIPLYSRQAKKINDAQKALGLYKEDNAVDNIRGKIRVFSSLTTWALENGIITADSIAARGYGIKKRTFYSRYSFDKRDVLMLITTLLLFVLTITAVVTGYADFGFYPEILPPKPSVYLYISYLSYFLLGLIPVAATAGERLRWKYLLSRV